MPRILRAAGTAELRTSTRLTLGMGLVKTGCTVLAAACLDGWGRRPMLLLSAVGMIVALLTLALSFGDEPSPAAALAAIFGYMGAFSLGFGPACWLVPAEAFPSHLRAKAMSVATVLNRLVAAAVASTFLSAVAWCGYGGYFGVWAAVVGALLVYVFFCVPETAGISLEEMPTMFDRVAAGELSVHRPTSAGRDDSKPLDLYGIGTYRT